MTLILIEFNRIKLTQYFIVSGGLCCGIWLLFFWYTNILSYLSANVFNNGYGRRRGGGLVLYPILVMPVATAVFGRLSAIILVGALRSVRNQFRRLGAHAT
jgi:hypothetical protein